MMHKLAEHEYAELLDEMITEETPRLFAVVQELGERVDARIAGWGLAFPDHVAVTCDDGRSVLSLRSPEGACRLLSQRPDVSARVVWIGEQDEE